MKTTKNGKGYHQKVCFFPWCLHCNTSTFLEVLSRKTFQNCLSTILAFYLDILQKNCSFFFQPMTLFTMNTANIALKVCLQKFCDFSLVLVYWQIIRQKIYAISKKVLSHQGTVINTSKIINKNHVMGIPKLFRKTFDKYLTGTQTSRYADSWRVENF